MSKLLFSTMVWACAVCLGTMTLLAGCAGVTDKKKSHNDDTLIEIVEVPLSGAIRYLAQITMGLNIIFDPAAPGSGFAAGRLAKNPEITLRREGVLPADALHDLLNKHGLVMVTNPATTVARIAPKRLGIKPVPASLVGADANGVLLDIRLDDVTLAEALRQVGQTAGLRVWFDPNVPASLLEESVWIRWKKLTARQALAALIDNYGFVLEENAVTRDAQVRLKD